jgi:hypothetical protein
MAGELKIDRDQFAKPIDVIRFVNQCQVVGPFFRAENAAPGSAFPAVTESRPAKKTEASPIVNSTPSLRGKDSASLNLPV